MKQSAQTGFSLIEIAVVLVIISILLAIVAVPLSTQIDQRRRADTMRQLDLAKDAITGFAISNGRLPCPALKVTGCTNGSECFCSASVQTRLRCHCMDSDVIVWILNKSISE